MEQDGLNKMRMKIIAALARFYVDFTLMAQVEYERLRKEARKQRGQNEAAKDRTNKD